LKITNIVIESENSDTVLILYDKEYEIKFTGRIDKSEFLLKVKKYLQKEQEHLQKEQEKIPQWINEKI